MRNELKNGLIAGLKSGESSMGLIPEGRRKRKTSPKRRVLAMDEKSRMA